jgi:hypothetical protein
MTRFSAWMTAVGACVMIWHECAENPAIFCYRIGRRAFTGIRSRSFFLEPAMIPVTRPVSRNDSRCSNPSGNFSTRSTMLKD